MLEMEFRNLRVVGNFFFFLVSNIPAQLQVLFTIARKSFRILSLNHSVDFFTIFLLSLSSGTFIVRRSTPIDVQLHVHYCFKSLYIFTIAVKGYYSL
ncbi:unnamed protein product [Phytomonas sp. EM1]|nr:unnamed protein product [Phytomonas sp. EM1]|eukprot:CCW62934.1 unnamed protein product [Phytomonas sp. isolate EM1]